MNTTRQHSYDFINLNVKREIIQVGLIKSHVPLKSRVFSGLEQKRKSGSQSTLAGFEDEGRHVPRNAGRLWEVLAEKQ